MLNIFNKKIHDSFDLLDYLKKNDFVIFNPEKEILYKYVDLNTVKLILENHSLKFSCPDEFNDPFELSTILFKIFKKGA